MSDDPRKRAGALANVARSEMKLATEAIARHLQNIDHERETFEYWSKRDAFWTALQASMDRGAPVVRCRGECYAPGEYAGCCHGDDTATAYTSLNCQVCYGSGWQPAEDV